MDMKYQDDLRSQIRESYGKEVYSYTAHLKYMHRLMWWEHVIKYAQIFLSAISTGGIIGTIVFDTVLTKFIGAIFSTLLLAINLFFRGFNLADEIKRHQVASDNLWCIREDYISLLTDIDQLTPKNVIVKRDELQARTAEVYRDSPKTDKRSYKCAQKALKNDEEQYFTIDEIDKILPKYLRIGK